MSKSFASVRSYPRVLGHLDQAVKLYEQTVVLDPLRANSYVSFGQMLYVAGRYDEARAALQQALGLNPLATYAHVILGQILIAQGKPQQALAEIEKEPNEGGKLTGEVLAYHALGRKQDSNAALAVLIAKYDTFRLIKSLRCMRIAGSPTNRLNGWSVPTTSETPDCPHSTPNRCSKICTTTRDTPNF
jgi:tetratricopeptide (TPR) repeat protein